MTDEAVEQMVQEVKCNFNGRDPVAELAAYIIDLDQNELRKLIMLSTNKIGAAINGKDYSSPYEAAMCVNLGAEILLSSYKSASMMSLATTTEVGNA